MSLAAAADARLDEAARDAVPARRGGRERRRVTPRRNEATAAATAARVGRGVGLDAARLLGQYSTRPSPIRNAWQSICALMQRVVQTFMTSGFQPLYQSACDE